MAGPERPAGQSYRRQARALSHVLDTAFRVPGTNWRFGLDPIIGLIPGLGDLVASGLSSYIIYLASHAGAPRSLLVRMVFNVAVDTVIGAIPFAGDLFDAAWKANVRNTALLQRFLDDPQPTRAASRRFAAVLILILIVMAGLAIWLAAALIHLLIQSL